MLKIAWLAPCIGVGGGDGFMFHMIRQSVNTKTVGIALEGQHNPKRWSTTPKQFRRSLGSLGQMNVPIYQIQPVVKERSDGIRMSDAKVRNEFLEEEQFVYTESLQDAVYEATKDADVVIEWCFPYLPHVTEVIGDKPIISLTQNEDHIARKIASTNAEKCYRHVGVSRAAANAFPSPFKQKAQVIYNGIDLNRVSPKLGGAALRHQWKTPKDAKILMFHGRLCQEKNPQAIIQAISLLPDEWFGVIVGDGTEKARVEEEATRHAPGRICFIESSWDAVGDLLDAADVFMLASDFEGMPLAVAEAWAAGLPVVASEFTVMRELREKYSDMAVYVSHDPRATKEELAAAVLKADSEEFKPVVSYAREIAWRKFSISHITMLWEMFLTKALHEYRTERYVPRVKCNTSFGATFVAPEVV